MGEGSEIDEIKNFKGFLGLNYEDRKNLGRAFLVVNLLSLLACVYYFQELRVAVNKMAYPALFEKYEACAASGQGVVVECLDPALVGRNLSVWNASMRSQGVP